MEIVSFFVNACHNYSSEVDCSRSSRKVLIIGANPLLLKQSN